MICDKCGFEHNSKSVCPKCGARAVYIDEEYLKRKKAWEEAQKNGGDVQRDFSRDLPPGIMFSSRDEGDEKPEPDEDIEQDEGAGFLAGLSFATIKEKVCSAFILTAEFIKRLVLIRADRRKNKPDRPSSRRPKLITKREISIAAGAVALIIIAVIIGKFFFHDKDNTSVFIYDGKYAYNSDDMDNSLWGSPNGVTYTTGNDIDRYMVCGSAGIIYYEGTDSTELTKSVAEAKVIARTDSLNMVFFSQNSKYYVYTIADGLKEVNVPDKGSITEECGTADNGEYYTFTMYDSKNDCYTLFEGNSLEGSVKEICTGSGRISILATENNSNVLYMVMDTAEYGIINNIRLCYYDGEQNRNVADDIIDAQYSDGNVFYIKKNGKLYRSSMNEEEPVLIDTNVTAFSDSKVEGSEDSLIYETETGYYCLDPDEDESILLFNASSSALKIYYSCEEDYLYYTDMNSLFFVAEFGNDAEKVCTMAKENQIIWLDDCLLAIDSEGNLLQLTDDSSIVDEKVFDIQCVINDNGYAYVQDNAWYYKKNTSSTAIRLSNDGEKTIADTKVIYSDGNIYYLDSSKVLWKIAMDGDSRTSLGATEYFMLLK